MNTEDKAKRLFFIGCIIAGAGFAQIAVCITSGRPGFAAIGAVCFGVAVWSCITNWELWHRGSR